MLKNYRCLDCGTYVKGVTESPWGLWCRSRKWGGVYCYFVEERGSQQDEIESLLAVLSHPATFDVCHGDLIAIRRRPGHFVVKWRDSEGPHWESFDTSSLKEAVTFFVSKRHELRIGHDFLRDY